ncbi:hypothetical protein DDB_G0283561 [Dictyostelium discoideum AX4]|uniref:Uncharacterized protein n=1 Tax=Dictyostelium discoideum TaxID=44689 RepID=Q54QW8_DICDI|nr:hypothetical protein DDB_G0283561 [Dictyostelium discoideum AX4]EAL65658.1 hypothetical protein DDB_G0283561 [Dictyostelium discoideum AX4]|eukprot:XP_639016.1 hypothetical protein DDB_G0283561 [Dictyostelium discoideum AX4]
MKSPSFEVYKSLFMENDSTTKFVNQFFLTYPQIGHSMRSFLDNNINNIENCLSRLQSDWDSIKKWFATQL